MKLSTLRRLAAAVAFVATLALVLPSPAAAGMLSPGSAAIHDAGLLGHLWSWLEQLFGAPAHESSLQSAPAAVGITGSPAIGSGGGSDYSAGIDPDGVRVR